MGFVPEFSEIQAEKYLPEQAKAVAQVVLTDPDEIWQFGELFLDQFGSKAPVIPPSGTKEQTRWQVTVITDEGAIFCHLLIFPDLVHIETGREISEDWAPDPDSHIWNLLESKLPS